jgi:transcription termination/antitermination protein NusA
VSLTKVIEELVEERDLDRAILADIIVEGMLSGYTKKYPDLELKVAFDKGSGKLRVDVQKEVVSHVDHEGNQISLRKARYMDPKVQLGDKIWLPFDGAIGRVEILKAKQIIAQRIREIETQNVYNAFRDKEGMVVQGVVYKNERGGSLIKLQDTLAFLPRSLSIPGEKLVPGYPIKALLKEVLTEPRNDNQLVLDRTSDRFLKKLFEMEIPEVFEGLVEIKALVRDPGYKSKVVVGSHDLNIDPVGTCVGVGGARIKPILKELGGEKIDIILSASTKEELVRNALKPAEINRVEVLDSVARVWLNDDQRSLAIGKLGKNIALASRLADVNIELVESDMNDRQDFVIDEKFTK